MVWQYLSQFWDQITAIGEYPVSWFQNIGNAVAGALGNFLDTIFHTMADLFLFIQWLFANLKVIFTALLSPVNYIFSVLTHFWGSAFSTPPDPAFNYTFSPEVLSVFNSIPHWSVIMSILGALVIVIAGVSILKLFLHT